MRLKVLCFVLTLSMIASPCLAQVTEKDIPYSNPASELERLDVYSPKDAKALPVVFWIHGGGWQAGDKAQIDAKPAWFNNQKFVFVSTNYRLLPSVEMKTIVQDVAKGIGWVHKNIERYGGDPSRIFVMGHSAGAQLAALVCVDERYLQAEGVTMSSLRGCVPVDGDTFDIPAIIEVAETRCRVHHLPQATFGHRQKFGNDPDKHLDFSAVTHIVAGKKIPPFLTLYVEGHPDTSAQAKRLHNVLTHAGLPSSLFAGKRTDHSKLNEDLGTPNDLATDAILKFISPLK